MSTFPTYEEGLAKMQRYCAYQERCHSEVRNKLLQIKVYGDTLEEIISALVQEGYLNELRFAKTFTSGKYRLKSWGRNKIELTLKTKKISDYCIKKALESIEEEEYMEALNKVLVKYFIKYKQLDAFKLRGKLFKYATNKGYTPTEINTVLESIPGVKSAYQRME